MGHTGVITKHHAHLYFGFAETEWKQFLKGPGEQPPVRRALDELLTTVRIKGL